VLQQPLEGGVPCLAIVLVQEAAHVREQRHELLVRAVHLRLVHAQRFGPDQCAHRNSMDDDSRAG
jgi:hypothetical protein